MTMRVWKSFGLGVALVILALAVGNQGQVGWGQGAAGVLILQDAPPWEEDINPRVLKDLGISFEVKGSGSFSRIDYTRYCQVLISSDQPQEFYDALAFEMSKLEEYVRNGGILEFHAAYDGWNGGSLEVPLPGGVDHHRDSSDPNQVTDLTHPIVQGIPKEFTGNYASHVYFSGLLPGTKVITVDAEDRPTTIEYRLGSGVVIASGVTLEWAVKKDKEYAAMLPNMMQYAQGLCGLITPAIALIPQDYKIDGDRKSSAVRFDGLIVGGSFDLYLTGDFNSRDECYKLTIEGVTVYDRCDIGFQDEPLATTREEAHFIGTFPLPDPAKLEDRITVVGETTDEVDNNQDPAARAWIVIKPSLILPELRLQVRGSVDPIEQWDCWALDRRIGSAARYVGYTVAAKVEPAAGLDVMLTLDIFYTEDGQGRDHEILRIDREYEGDKETFTYRLTGEDFPTLGALLTGIPAICVGWVDGEDPEGYELRGALGKSFIPRPPTPPIPGPVPPPWPITETLTLDVGQTIEVDAGFDDATEVKVYEVRVPPESVLSVQVLDCCVPGDIWRAEIYESYPELKDATEGDGSIEVWSPPAQATILTGTAYVVVRYVEGVDMFPAGMTIRFTASR